MSGSIFLPEIGAALFRSPTSSSNSEANTEDGRLMEDVSVLCSLCDLCSLC
uniref:Uncharacterized protein n=1 Tax=Labrus bergylta TaxID=56723 RepID=A0A3Q3E5A9_9LABR